MGATKVNKQYIAKFGTTRYNEKAVQWQLLIIVIYLKEVLAIEILRVSSTTDPKSAAGAIASIVRTNSSVEVSAVGGGAVNQAVKSIAIARGYVAPNGIDLICIPAFAETEINNSTKTYIKFIVEKR